jgi:hypothetical protein
VAICEGLGASGWEGGAESFSKHSSSTSGGEGVIRKKLGGWRPGDQVLGENISEIPT